MKYFMVIVLFTLFSCGNDEAILLPKANTSIVKAVNDLSSTYIFFRIKGKDTLADVNRKNSIISTNWILNVDRRLPLRIAIPEIIKLQQKKRGDIAHKNAAAENYYSYADTIGKNLAFIPFTNAYYKLKKPTSGFVIFFAKNNQIIAETNVIKQDEFQAFLDNRSSDKAIQYVFCFDKDLSFGSYIQNKIFINGLTLQSSDFNVKYEEFIY